MPGKPAFLKPGAGGGVSTTPTGVAGVRAWDGSFPPEIVWTTIDNFEDGADTTATNPDWNINDITGTSLAAVESDRAISGTYSLHYWNTGGPLQAHWSGAGGTYDAFRVKVRVSLDGTGGGNTYDLTLQDGNTSFARVRFAQDGGLVINPGEAGEQTLGSYTDGDVYTVEFTNIDYANSTFDVSVGGMSATGVAFWTGVSEVNALSAYINNFDGQPADIWIDDIAYGETE